MLNNLELATVLAALRHWQQSLAGNAGHVGKIPVSEHFDEQSPLTIEQIDNLCGRLNLAAISRRNGPHESTAVASTTVYVLYDYDRDELASTRVFNDYDEAVSEANLFNNVLVAPMVFEECLAAA